MPRHTSSSMFFYKTVIERFFDYATSLVYASNSKELLEEHELAKRQLPHLTMMHRKHVESLFVIESMPMMAFGSGS